MDLELGGRTALITGASRGIGRACARSLAAEGCNLQLVARTSALLEQLADELQEAYGIDVDVLPGDLADAEARGRVLESFDPDILINNAGAIPRGELTTLDDQALRSSWELKLFGSLELTRGCLPRMQARGAGVVVNVIGIAGVRPNAGYLAGSMANAALVAMTTALGATALRDGVRVLGVNPGLTLTDRAESRFRRVATERFGSQDRWRELLPTDPPPAEPDEVSDVVAFLASDRARHVSGTVIPVDGGRSQRW